MNNFKTFSITLLIFFYTISVLSQNMDLYKSEVFVDKSDTLKYRIMMPKDFDDSKKYPLLIFLHGAGERGNDNEKQLVHGSKLFANPINRGAFPAIIIFPQCPKEDYWSNAIVNRSTKPISLDYPLNKPPTTSLNLVLSFMDDYIKKPFINNNKIYIGGLSMGAMGTFETLYRRPHMFAAAFAICGGGNPETVKAYANNTELWVFHGAKDNVVDPQLSVAMVNAYLEAGGKPNFTLYADDNHNSWDSAFAEPKLLPWLFSKSKQ